VTARVDQATTQLDERSSSSSSNLGLEPGEGSSLASFWQGQPRQQRQQAGRPDRAAVLWLTGRAAAQLTRLSDAQVLG